jgi:hypothetical protein
MDESQPRAAHPQVPPPIVIPKRYKIKKAWCCCYHHSGCVSLDGGAFDHWDSPLLYIYFPALIIIRLPIGEIRKNVVCVGGGIWEKKGLTFTNEAENATLFPCCYFAPAQQLMDRPNPLEKD